MAVKPDGDILAIREQIIDLAGGLTLEFKVMRGSDAPMRLVLAGDNLPFGNYEVLFDRTGAEAGGGTALAGLCKPTWLHEVEL